MSEEEKDKFIFSFFPFMYGIYPYTEATEKQKLAMEKANVPFPNLSIYEIAYNGIIKIIKVIEVTMRKLRIILDIVMTCLFIVLMGYYIQKIAFTKY